jgi:hypothetical protein
MTENPAFAPPAADDALPNVLLIGDSISIGYTLAVRSLLQGRANVFRPAANCGPTIRGLAQLDDWLGDQSWSVIHFNFGLHDLKYIDDEGQMADPPESGQQHVPIGEYEDNLDRIVKRLRTTEAELIWCSTTPVPAGSAGRLQGDGARYNVAAARVAAAHTLAVDDLYTFALERLDSIQMPANVHFSDEGSAELATQVVASIQNVPPLRP